MFPNLIFGRQPGRRQFHRSRWRLPHRLSFLAVGTPAGVPPFSLLDGVSMVAVPEPQTWGMLGLGLGLVGFAARRRKAKAA